MVAIVTGDIVDSRKVAADRWMKTLKEELATWGKAGEDWEIYRGDSFQLKIKNPEEGLLAAVRLKAALRAINGLDCRMGIGVGTEDFTATRLLENNGTAYIHSGEAFDSLAEYRQKIRIKTPNSEFDEEINLMLKMSLTFMDHWTASSARMIHLVFKHPDKNQTELGAMEDISQHAVSARLSRANFSILESFLEYFPKRLKTQVG